MGNHAPVISKALTTPPNNILWGYLEVRGRRQLRFMKHLMRRTEEVSMTPALEYGNKRPMTNLKITQIHILKPPNTSIILRRKPF